MSTVWDFTVASFVVTISYILIWKSRAASTQLPPGPTPDILIGHARKLPFNKAWKVYARWKQIYGDVIYAHALGRSIVILNSVAAARDLLERKSLAFSDRPYLPVIYLMGWELTLPILRYGSRFRKQRRIMHQYLGPQAVASFRPMQKHEVCKFLRRLLESPDNFVDHVHSLVAGVIVLITYGHEVVSDDDAYVELVERAMHMTATSGSVGTTSIDIFPFLRYIPTWFPGAGLKIHALRTREAVDLVMTVPLEELKAKRAAGSTPVCLLSDLLDKYEEMGVVDHEHEEDIMNIGATIYNAGTDTTKSTLTTFFMLMTLHPETAKRAQKEIDEVIGTNRLPTLDDRKQLPYIDCILKEIYRILSPLPLGIPHRSTQTECYRGWTLPEGTMAIANIWQMMRDETVFSNPEKFSPERHADQVKASLNQAAPSATLDEGTTSAVENDPSSIVFGFGRRVCPGKYFVDSMLWMTMAAVLALFDIRPYVNPATGIEELPKLGFVNEIILSPKPFKCTVVPRSEKLAQMIQQEAYD